jgi:hypothetical protein
MKIYKQLFLIFAMAFAFALGGGIVFSAAANAQCTPCQLREPVYSGPHRSASPALYWHQFY